MKVFFTASYFGKAKYQVEFDYVRKAIEKKGVELLSPEKGNYLSVLKLSDYEKIRSKKRLHYEAVKRGIKWAQAVIIEVSHEDFQLGHEASLALQAKKPVLCLSIHEDFSKKIIHPFFFGAKYNEHTIELLVSDFIDRTNKENLKERFNLFLSSRQLLKLEEKAREKGMNNSEYLRLLLDSS